MSLLDTFKVASAACQAEMLNDKAREETQKRGDPVAALSTSLAVAGLASLAGVPLVDAKALLELLVLGTTTLVGGGMDIAYQASGGSGWGGWKKPDAKATDYRLFGTNIRNAVEVLRGRK